VSWEDDEDTGRRQADADGEYVDSLIESAVSEAVADKNAKLAAAYKVIRNAGINFVEDGAVDHATGTVAKETAAGGSGGVWGIDPDEADAIREAWEAA
jgi:hypothetical protein